MRLSILLAGFLGVLPFCPVSILADSTPSFGPKAFDHYDSEQGKTITYTFHSGDITHTRSPHTHKPGYIEKYYPSAFNGKPRGYRVRDWEIEPVLQVYYIENVEHPKFSAATWLISRQKYEPKPDFFYHPERLLYLIINPRFVGVPAVREGGMRMMNHFAKQAASYSDLDPKRDFRISLRWNEDTPMQMSAQIEEKIEGRWRAPKPGPYYLRVRLEGFSGDGARPLTDVYESRNPRPAENRVEFDLRFESFPSEAVEIPFYGGEKIFHPLTDGRRAAPNRDSGMNFHHYSVDLLNKLFLGDDLSVDPPNIAAGKVSVILYEHIKGELHLLKTSDAVPVHLTSFAEIIYSYPHEENSFGVGVTRAGRMRKIPVEKMGRPLSKENRVKLFMHDQVKLGWLDGVKIRYLLLPGVWQVRPDPEAMRGQNKKTVSLKLAHIGGSNAGGGSGVVGFIFDGVVSVGLDTLGWMGSVGNYLTGGLIGNAGRWAAGWFITESDEDFIRWIKISPKGTRIGMEFDENEVKLFLEKGAAEFSRVGGQGIELNWGQTSVMDRQGRFSPAKKYTDRDLSDSMRAIFNEMSSGFAINSGEKSIGGLVDETTLSLKNPAPPRSSPAITDEAIIDAVKDGDVKRVRLMLEQGGNVQAVDEYESSALLWAAFKGNAPMVKLLLEAGAIANFRNAKGDGPIRFAGVSGSIETVKLLLEAGVDVNSRHQKGSTVLYSACDMGHLDLVKYLVEEAGADIHIGLFSGTMPVDIAQKEGYTEIVEYLRAQGAE